MSCLSIYPSVCRYMCVALCIYPSVHLSDLSPPRAQNCCDCPQSFCLSIYLSFPHPLTSSLTRPLTHSPTHSLPTHSRTDAAHSLTDTRAYLFLSCSVSQVHHLPHAGRLERLRSRPGGSLHCQLAGDLSVGYHWVRYEWA